MTSPTVPSTDTATITSTPRDHLAHVLRITLETTSPVALGSGAKESADDAPCVLDANGLPALPGTSLAGALRAWWRVHLQDANQADDTRAWFGYESTQASQNSSGQASLLHISWGSIHNVDNVPQIGIRRRDALAKDAILGPLMLNASSYKRDHVALTCRGAAKENHKFDRNYVPTGHRFTFQITLRTETSELAKDWATKSECLITALLQGEIVLGSAKTAGYGRVKAVAAQSWQLDLAISTGRQALQNCRQFQSVDGACLKR